MVVTQVTGAAPAQASAQAPTSAPAQAPAQAQAQAPAQAPAPDAAPEDGGDPIPEDVSTHKQPVVACDLSIKLRHSIKYIGSILTDCLCFMDRL